MDFHPKEITIRHQDSTYTFPKDSVYGIRHCDGSIVRLYENTNYPLINPSETILLYKVASGTGIKNSPIITEYYFSKDAESKIQDLTIDNMKTAFPDNHRFHDLVDMEFRSNGELATYDKFHQIMKINRVLQLSLQEK